MIPLKLELKNFLSYGDSLTTINFSDYELICLSGKNGNGKSALLDAITWALWGQARKVSGNTKADAGLIRLGQTRMMVSMEFLCSGQRYRVRREYAKTYGKPYASLSIELFDETQKDFVALTEKTIRQTQEKVEKIVGLDFDTFINSAFLRQGQANEFSQKTPKERKQILATILGLGKYDALQKRSLEHARVHLDERKVIEKLQEQAAVDLEHEKTFEEKLVTQKKEHKEIEQQVSLATKNRENKEQECLVFSKQKYVYEIKIKEQDSLQQAKNNKREKLREIITLWRRVHASSLCGPTLKILEQEREKLLAHDKKLRQAQQDSVRLQEKLLLVKEKLNKIILEKEQESQVALNKKRLLVDKQALQVNQFLLQKKQKVKALSDRKRERDSQQKILNKISKELVDQKDFTKEFESFTKQFEKRRIFYQNLVQRGNWTQTQFKELQQKKRIAHDKENPSCPLCEQILTLKRKQFLVRTLATQELFL
ncbi:SMC family ATPase, partial [Candidatus Babeliales bacterium]|nr:SMC family ATPase [Candidatus Babeliales bacterium]